eukprot:TRINITY_DN1327_c0_g1_i4.p1 TRINITY_DN1327_c0_g1~~TRINITY_DN1327_c0_g1_i4.p1  ORF type:complete len:695 (-),score=120.32 TRINITY_DN1327_c0_g1_i4:47-2131(-)
MSTTAVKTQYPNNLRFDLTPEEIRNSADTTIAASKARLDAVVASVGVLVTQKLQRPQFAETPMQALSDEDFEFGVASSNAYFPSQVSADKSIRDASTEANQKLEAYSVEKELRHDVYLAVKRYVEHLDSIAKSENASASWESLFSTEEVFFTKKILQGFERNGLHLPSEKQSRLKLLRQEMSEISIKFQQNLNEDQTSFEFTREELDGMPESYFDSLKISAAGKFIVSLKYPDLFPLMKKCKVDATRRIVYTAKESQCMAQNVPLFERLIRLRQEEAELLGFKNHAEYILDIRMAKNAQTVFDFLNRLVERLEPAFQDDIKALLSLKRKDAEASGIPFDGRLQSWDWRYYQNLVLENDYSINAEEIREYFPMDHVLAGMLGIFQEILSLRFEEVAPSLAHVWHPEVRQFSVFDLKSGAFVGHFYLDLHPREGKYGHAAEFGLQKGCVARGSRQAPAAAMVANFSKATPDRPSLLDHDEVVTLFHEFGHVMHELMSTGRFAPVAGTNVQRDFVEAPSQMLENWVYEKQTMLRISRHFQTGSPLPDDVMQKLINAKNATIGLLLRRQLFFAIFDMTVHTLSPDRLSSFDSAAYWSDIAERVMGIRPPEGTNGVAGFSHLTGGYSAGYYGYLWSEVYSADMFDKFKREGIFSPETGLQYREKILAPGGSCDAMDLLVAFLGRAPTEDSFLKHIGLVH